jgi:hypothetical protein
VKRLATFIHLDDEKVAEMYLSGSSLQEIADAMGVSYGTSRRAVLGCGLVLRPKGSVAGGGRWNNKGYWRVLLAPDDPMVVMGAADRLVLEHRLVMARHLGRPLTPSEQVHHINGDRRDNRIENLQLRSTAHGSGVRLECRSCGSQDITALPLP